MTTRMRNDGSRRRRLALAFALAIPGIPGTAQAQEQIGCLRGQPLPSCKSFWVMEMQGFVPLGQSTRTITYDGEPYYSFQAEAFDNQLEWNVGHMLNLGARHAVGAVFTVGTGGPDPLTGIKLRGRRWLGRDLSLEVETGLLRSDAGGTWWAGANGWTTDVRFNIRDQGSFFLRYDRLSLPEESVPDYNGYFDPGGVYDGVSVGASAGSIPALVGTGALGLALVILFSLADWSD